MTTLTLYMKPGCHLCEGAAGLLQNLAPEFAFAIHEVDITSDPALRERYGDFIPVVELEGRQLLAAPFGEASARKALHRALKSPLPGGEG